MTTRHLLSVRNHRTCQLMNCWCIFYKTLQWRIWIRRLKFLTFLLPFVLFSAFGTKFLFNSPFTVTAPFTIDPPGAIFVTVQCVHNVRNHTSNWFLSANQKEPFSTRDIIVIVPHARLYIVSTLFQARTRPSG